MTKMIRLTRDFFAQPTLVVARDLIGCRLFVNAINGLRCGQIIETEAYAGPHDQASHASRGRTTRNQPMFGPPGFTYIYLIYGMYWCLNLVTETEGYPAAVLIRAVSPITPLDDPKVASGPGKLCRWLGLDRTFNQIDATGNLLYIEKDETTSQPPISQGRRIGVDYAGQWAAKPWRFGWTNHPALSKRM